MAAAARDEILSRVARALSDVPSDEEPEDVAVPREYGREESVDVVALFVERASEYRAEVRRVRPNHVAAAVSEVCRAHGLTRLGVPDDLPAHWLPGDVEAVPAGGLGPRELDTLGAALTGCALAVAETGTIVFDAGARQGLRVLSLVPDHHVCIVEEHQIVGSIPEALGRIGRSIRDGRRPVTLVSGPSATSDIELDRVEGVHGPRDLVILVVSKEER